MGRSTTEVANEFGLSVDYVYDLRQDPLVVDEIERLSNLGVEHSTKKVMTVRAMAADKSAEALNKLVKLMNDSESNPNIVIKSAHEILTFGGIKPPDRTEIDLTTHQSNKLMLLDDSHVDKRIEGTVTDDDRRLAELDDNDLSFLDDADYDDILDSEEAGDDE